MDPLPPVDKIQVVFLLLQNLFFVDFGVSKIFSMFSKHKNNASFLIKNTVNEKYCKIVSRFKITLLF